MHDKLLLKPSDFKPTVKSWEVKGALNPGAIRMPNKKVMLMVRVAESGTHKHGNAMKCPVMTSGSKVGYQKIPMKDVLKKGAKGEIFLKDGVCRLPTISHFKRVILSKDGFEVEKIEQRSAFVGKTDDGDFGVEDPRIVKIGNRYYMTYVGISRHEGISSYLAVSRDLKSWKRLGLIFREQNKDVMLFPEKVKGRYVALNRPEATISFTKPSIWISYSKDLMYWGMDENLMRPRDGWESSRIGGGCPPIKTNKGWLMIYHGMRPKGKGSEYSAGAALLSLNDPGKVIARTPARKSLFSPSKRHEKKGFINNVVFPTGVVSDLNGKDLLVYSGGADSYTTVKRLNLKEILDSLEKV